MGRSIHESAKQATLQAIAFWEKAKIPIRREQHCIEKLKKLFDEWRLITRNSSRDSQLQRKKEKEFETKISKLFDIAHGNALDMMQENGRLFLTNQRSDERQGCLAGVDKKLMEKDKRKANRIAAENDRRERCQQQQQAHSGKYF